LADATAALGAYADLVVLLGFVLGALLLLAGFLLDSWKSGEQRPGDNAFVADFFKVLGAGCLAGAVYLYYIRSLV